MRNIIIASLLAAACSAASAQPQLWRCGASYGQVPCEGGAAVRPPPPVSAAQSAQARSVGKADARLADAMEKARLQQERQAPKAVIPAAKPASAAASKPMKKAAPANGKPQLLTAVAPGAKDGKK
ncbi:MAG: hypothetical protein JWP65_3950 [Ramlibacter sp.]|jgi:hypothetical protein|uniref:hypothetical protein n=1 Tax=Ramlibacter sp. TaxID=1917967 RepID=UPI0026168FED|nr:hypothetical protein [Ramlibacter sp.]MDB5753529.1 hypothetical protein [Ramlibacter sp.]